VNGRIHPTLAAALAPMAPPSSVVHKIVEDARLQADQHYNELKNSGELERRRIAAAIRNERVHPWEQKV
jgi:hypothetical protein